MNSKNNTRSTLAIHLPALLLLLFVLPTILGSGRIIAQSVTPLVNYQGQMLNANGQPFRSTTTGGSKITIRIFNDISGGDELWGPQVFEGVQIVDGWFNLMIGPNDSSPMQRSILDAFESGERFLDIEIDGKLPNRPRQRVASTPFALRAQSTFLAEHAETATVAETVRGPSIFVSPANGNTGIGTQTPSETLEVNGDIKATNFIGDGSQLKHLPNRNVTTQALTIFVDAAGNDDGQGTMESPFRTIDRALELVPRFIEHDITVILMPGRYNQLTEIFNRVTHIDRGSLTIQSYKPAGQTLFDSSSVTFTGRDNFFRIGNTTGLSILGVTFAPSPGSDVTVYVIQRSNVALEQCLFRSARGIIVRMFSSLFMEDVVFNGLDNIGNPTGNYAVIADFYSRVHFADGGSASDEKISNTINGYEEGVKLRHFSSSYNAPAPTILNTTNPIIEIGNSLYADPLAENPWIEQ